MTEEAEAGFLFSKGFRSFYGRGLFNPQNLKV
jgi:hypothetical protein